MLHSDSLGVENSSNNLNNRKPGLKNNCHFHLERNCIKTDFPLSKLVMRSLRIYATMDFIGRYYQGTQNHDHWQNICPPNNWNSLLCWAKALMAGWWVPILGLSLQGWLNLTRKARGSMSHFPLLTGSEVSSVEDESEWTNLLLSLFVSLMITVSYAY